MKTCKVEGCPLTRSADVMTLPEGAKPALCWQHQPETIRSLERQRRRAQYQQWLIDTAPSRREYFKKVDEQVYETKGSEK